MIHFYFKTSISITIAVNEVIFIYKIDIGTAFLFFFVLDQIQECVLNALYNIINFYGKKLCNSFESLILSSLILMYDTFVLSLV